MGDNARARENLFRFYNSSPDSEMNHLVFTKIADTYRDEGLVQDGTKLYQLVLERYPDSEGALISRIRLAEQQEEGELQIKRGIAPKVKIVGTEIGLPREMYENVMNDLLKKGKKSPLAQLALLKLAILYQKEKDYDKSLKALKDLLREYPWTSLRKESKHVLLWTIQAILNEEMERKRYINIINIYHREKELFFMVKSPDAFLTIARASKQLNLEDMALEMFKNADALLADKKNPQICYFL
jgi:tetratricopeptide (TPR) repeat protein